MLDDSINVRENQLTVVSGSLRHSRLWRDEVYSNPRFIDEGSNNASQYTYVYKQLGFTIRGPGRHGFVTRSLTLIKQCGSCTNYGVEVVLLIWLLFSSHKRAQRVVSKDPRSAVNG